MKSRRQSESVPYLRSWHSRLLGIAGAGALALAVLPGAASAHVAPAIAIAPRPLAVSAGGGPDLGALNAYHGYLSALTSREGVSASRDAQLVASVDSGCPHELSSLANLSPSQLRKSALSDFGDEVDADLDLAYLEPSSSALQGFASGLSSLTWPTAGEDTTMTRLISAEHTMLVLPRSSICADATTLDAAPLSEPTGTARLLGRYRRAASGLHAALSAFQALVSRDETSAETRVITQINTLVAQFSNESRDTEQNAATTVLSDLGVSGH